jgi:3-oxoacyl-[acyl-carrier-protein] synthase II
MEACDLRRVVSADLGEAFVAQLGIDCPAWVVHGACASGLVALQVADDLLEAGVLDAVVVICADTLSRVAYAGFHRVGAMSALGSTPFDASRDGMTLSEAGAALVCTREPGPGDQVAMRSVAVNCDRSGTVEPSAAGVEAALRACLDGAATQGTEVDFVYWHGTGTRLNDEAEFGAAMRVFEGGVPPGTSTKGVLGHTMGASALINVMAACETLYCRALPGCAGMSAPAFPALNVSPAATPVPGARNGVCVALGFGGINSAALLSRAEAAA